MITISLFLTGERWWSLLVLSSVWSINRRNLIWPSTMLLCVFFLVLSVPFATAKTQTACGIIGQAVSLNPGSFGNFNKKETFWTFHHSDENPVVIVDYFPGKSIEYPNKQFTSRLQYSTSTGSLKIQNLRLEDQGNFTFRVGDQKNVLELIVIEPITTNISCRSGKSVSFPGIQELEKCSSIMVQWQKISENLKNKRGMSIVWQLQDTGSSEPAISENYEGRIDYDLSNASFILQDVVSGDKGVYQLSIIQPDIIVQTVHLILKEISWKEMMIIGASLIALVLSLFYHGAFLALRWKKPKQDYKSLIVCNILSLVFTMIALSFWINIKDDVFPAVVALCTVSFWVLTMIAVFVSKCSLIKRVFYLSKGFPSWIGLLCSGVIPLSIVILKEAIQQSNQRCQTISLTPIFIVSLVICFIIVFLSIAMCCGRKRNASNELSAETEQQLNEELQGLKAGDLNRSNGPPLISQNGVTGNNSVHLILA